MRKSSLLLVGALLLGIIVLLSGCDIAAPWTGKIKVLFVPSAGSFDDGTIVALATPEADTNNVIGAVVIDVTDAPAYSRAVVGSEDTSIDSQNFGIGSYYVAAITDLDNDGIVASTDYIAETYVSLIEYTNPIAEFNENDFGLVPSSIVGMILYE